MDYVDDLYYIMWSSRGLEHAFNHTAHEKNLMVNILKDEVDTKLISNPLRDMIVNGMVYWKN